jgi:hypothetical protein
LALFFCHEKAQKTQNAKKSEDFLTAGEALSEARLPGPAA